MYTDSLITVCTTDCVKLVLNYSLQDMYKLLYVDHCQRRWSPGKLRQGYTSYRNMPAFTAGSSSMIPGISSGFALKIKMPLTGASMVMGPTMDNMPSAR